MNPPEIRIASIEERDQVIATVLLGFSSDPLTRWFWPDPVRYLEAGPGFDAFGGSAVEAGAAYVSSDFGGAALWIPPGSHADEERMAEFIVQTVPSETLPDALAVFAKMEEFHPDEPVWYLPLIAVDPAHQGKGIGSALMKEVLKRVDQDGLPAYLESSNPRNISLYERHGFETIGEIQIGSSPLVTPMYRPAR